MRFSHGLGREDGNAGIAGVLQIAAAMKPFPFIVRELDPDPYLINVANGTLDLRTMQLRRHNPADRITKVTAAAWDPTAHGEVWEAFLARVLPDAGVRDFLRRYVGLGLAGAVLEHVLAILTGSGRNGKGVLYGALNHTLGDYAGVAEPDLFMHRDGAHPTGEMDLRGLRWVVVSESDHGRRLAEATVKRLTGGDQIKARRMRQDFVEFRPSHTAALVTNHLPSVSGDDPALWARLRVVPFDVVIPREEQDPHLPDKLQLEADAILSWAIAGWVEHQQLGLAEPAGVIKATDNYHAASDALTRFLAECCLIGPSHHAAVTRLWDRWLQWRADDGSEELSKRAFGDALDKRGYPVHRGSKGLRIRRGIGLCANDEEESSNAW